ERVLGFAADLPWDTEAARQVRDLPPSVGEAAIREAFLHVRDRLAANETQQAIEALDWILVADDSNELAASLREALLNDTLDDEAHAALRGRLAAIAEQEAAMRAAARAAL